MDSVQTSSRVRVALSYFCRRRRISLPFPTPKRVPFHQPMRKRVPTVGKIVNLKKVRSYYISFIMLYNKSAAEDAMINAGGSVQTEGQVR